MLNHVKYNLDSFDVDSALKSTKTYVRVVGDDSDTCFVLSNWHSFNQTHNVFTDILEVLFFNGTG